MGNETQVVEYNVTDAAIAEMSEMYLPLVITDLDDKEQFDAVHSARLVVKGKRIEVDKKRKELKADALAWGKKVQTEANRIFALIEPIESHLKKEENKVAEEKQRLEDERIAKIKDEIESWKWAYHGFNSMVPVEQLKDFISKLEAIVVTPDLYFEFTTEATDTIGKLITRANQDVLNRELLDREEAERKAESERLAAEKKVQDEQAAMLKKQQDILDENERQIKAERDALEAEKKAEQERKDREQFEKEAKEQAKRDAAETIRIAERDRIEKERLDVEEAERKKALLPDKEKMIAFSQFLQEGVTIPAVTSDEAKKIIKQAAKDIYDVGEEILVATKDM